MATKPGTIPTIWANGGGGVYTTGPFIGQPNMAIPGGAVGVDGHRPGAANPTPAEYQNYQQHWGSSWIVNWLAQGLSTAAANTHIVETDADGRTEVVGLDITDVVDRTVGTWTCSNTAAPALVMNTPGAGLRINSTGFLSNTFEADLTGGFGIGFSAVDGPGDGAKGFAINLHGSGGIGTMASTNAFAPGLDISLSASSQDTLVLSNGGTGAPVRMTPQVPPAVKVRGQFWPDTLSNDFQGVRNSGATTRFWSSEQGYTISYKENGVAAVPSGNYISTNWGFVAGKQYIFDYSFSYGRIATSTRDIVESFNIGGFAFPIWTGRTIGLFQGGGVGQIEGNWTRRFVWTSFVTGLFNVNLAIFQTGAGVNLQIDSGCLTITGALD